MVREILNYNPVMWRSATRAGMSVGYVHHVSVARHAITIVTSSCWKFGKLYLVLQNTRTQDIPRLSALHSDLANGGRSVTIIARAPRHMHTDTPTIEPCHRSGAHLLRCYTLTNLEIPQSIETVSYSHEYPAIIAATSHARPYPAPMASASSIS